MARGPGAGPCRAITEKPFWRSSPHAQQVTPAILSSLPADGSSPNGPRPRALVERELAAQHLLVDGEWPRTGGGKVEQHEQIHRGELVLVLDLGVG